MLSLLKQSSELIYDPLIMDFFLMCNTLRDLNCQDSIQCQPWMKQNDLICYKCFYVHRKKTKRKMFNQNILLNFCVPRFFNLAKISLTVLVTFALCWMPFLSDPKQPLQVLHRLFPVDRGLFEVIRICVITNHLLLTPLSVSKQVPLN